MGDWRGAVDSQPRKGASASEIFLSVVSGSVKQIDQDSSSCPMRTEILLASEHQKTSRPKQRPNCPRISPVPIGLADASEEIDLLLTNLERGVIHPGDNRQTGDRNTVVVESLVGIHAYDRFTAAFENQLPLVLGKVF